MRTRTLSIPVTAAILTVALLAFEPVAFGQKGDSGGDSETKELSLDLGKGVSMKLVHIPAGKFKMGNHDTPAGTVKKVGGFERNLVNEYPAHEVTISKPFYMGIYEVTQAQWGAVMGTEPWMTEQALHFGRLQPRPKGFDDYPVVFVSSYDAIEFCRKLSKKTGMTVSLPSEAQWEYACRAGSATTFSFGDELSKLIDHGWYGGIRAGQKEDYAHRVGQLKPNAWGLYDMHGNVWEFCSDWYDKDFYSRSPSVDPENTTETDKRSLRSGSFHSVPTVSRSAQRNSWTGPKTVRYNYGLRVIVSADTKEKQQQVEPQFRHLYRTMGEKSSTKIKLVSGPEAINMRNGQVPGKRWFATSGKFKFKLTIQDGVDLKVEKLIERLQKLPLPYIRAYEVVSDEKEDGVAVYKSLGGAAAHGGKQYINIIPGAGPMVLAHEVGHTLEQKARESDLEILDKWEAAIEADKVSISNYGDKVRHEDLGEFSKVYAACLDAGEAQLSKLRKLSPARFKLWEKILKDQDVTTGKLPEDPTAARHLTLNLGKGVSMKLVHIPAGKFKMGNHDTPAETVKKVGGWMSWPGHPHHGRTDQRQVDEEHLTDEYPVHEVTISKPFYMGIYEVTQAQWKAVMATEPWMTKQALGFARMQPRPQGFDDYPVVWVSSYDAIAFCRKLSKKTGRTVSLPTEAQWEYACRAGSTTAFSFGDKLSKLNDNGWYGGRRRDPKGDYAHRVGQKKPNAWGLYDMHGNVWEFCSDWYDKDFYSRSPSVDPENTTETDKRSLRSGSFHSVPTVSRSAQRNSWTGPKTVRYNYGLRVVVATGASAKDQLKSHFKPIFKKFGQNSTTKIKVVSGPEAVQMRNGRVAGKQWVATSGEYRFKLTIEDATGAKLEQLVGRLEKLPGSYMSACVAVSDKGEDGIAIYADLGGARAHGGKGYINLVPHADALVIAHEAGHTLEQVATQSDPKILDKWEAAIKADQISVSDYGDKVRHEDLGEFAQVYAVCLDAGPEHLAELKKLSPKRFALWQRILTPYSPEALRKTLDPFYKQHIVADGLVVAGSEKVSLYALGEAGYLAKKMLANRPDLIRDLCEKRKMFVAVMAYCELQTDLPDCRHMSLWWAYRARGLGSRPVSCAEENLLNLKGDPFQGENIFVHEFAHGIHSVLGEEFNARLRVLFDQAKQSGRFGGYAIDGGIGEFWAEGVQTWFECNGKKRPKSGRGSNSFTVIGPQGELVCHLTTRKLLRTHCPEFARLLDSTFRQNKWVYVPVAKRLNEPHLSGFDPADAPEFRWPAAVVKAFDRIEAENAKKEKQRKTKSSEK